MKTLLKYEIKKILMKKSTFVAFGVLFGIQVFLAISGSLGSTYVGDEFVETHMERNQMDRELGLTMSGRAIDEELLTEVREAAGKIEGDGREYLLSEVYQTEVRKYSDVMNKLRMWGLGSFLAADNMAEQDLYELRRQRRDELWDNYELTERERTYWLEKEAELKLPLIYEYAGAYDSLLNMQGGYMCCMLLTFFIGISMVSVFVEEHTRKTDQLILCSRYGRTKLYFAKILAGSIVVFVTNLLFVSVGVAGKFFSYGSEGFRASIQVVTAFWYSYEMTAGVALLIMIGLLLLSSVLTAIFTMVLAEVLRNGIGAMAIVVGGLFAARLVVIPNSWRVLSQLWSYLPINLLKVDMGFTDLRLVPFFGMQLTTWQFAPILYVLLIVVLLCVGKRVYQSYQVNGR